MGKNAFTNALTHSRIHAFFLLLLLLAACNTKHREFRAADNAVVASCTYSGDDTLNAVWQFVDKEGQPLVPGSDSLRVFELGPDGHPMSVCFYKGIEEHWIQFYSSMQMRSEGSIVNGKREGVWTYYFPNGLKQGEYQFAGGLEEGFYRIFRESGVPYYVGQCRQGRNVGTWEIYNEDGSLAGTKDYGD